MEWNSSEVFDIFEIHDVSNYNAVKRVLTK